TLCSAAGDCDDNDPNAYPVVISTYGSAYGTGTDDDPYDTLDTALANLDQVCRTVVVETGTYTDSSVAWTSGTVTIIGRTGNPADVTIEPAQYDRHFFVDGATLTLQDLTLSGGDPPYDGGSIQIQNGTLTLDDVVLSGNTSGNDGGAIAATSSNLTF